MRAPPKVNHCPGNHLEKLIAPRIALCTDKAKFDLNPWILTELLISSFLHTGWYLLRATSLWSQPYMKVVGSESCLCDGLTFIELIVD